MQEDEVMVGLKIIRKKHNLNQQKVAMDLNMSRESLSYYENGKRCPDLETLVLLSKYLNVSIDYLITGKEFESKYYPLNASTASKNNYWNWLEGKWPWERDYRV